MVAGSGSPGGAVGGPLFFRPCGGGVSLEGLTGLLAWRVGRCGRRWGRWIWVTSTRVHRQNDLSGEGQKRLTVSSNDGQGRFRPTQRMLRPGFLPSPGGATTLIAMG